MALPDLEKRALPSLEDGQGYEFDEETPRRRALPWLGTFAVVLSLLAAIWWTAGQCLTATLSFTNHASIQAHRGYPGLASQAVISRSPTVDAADVDDDTGTGTTSAAAPTRTVLKVFEVDQPVLMPGGPAESDGSTRAGKDYSPELCTVLLMRHNFAWSYNAPFVGDYTPPDCEFNRVVLNFSVVSEGRQYDRLAIMYFGDTEVWRTSTAEPTVPPGISWTYLKDMTHYMYFWKSPQKVIFDLGNLINDKYTGIYNTTLTAIFFNSPVETDQAPPSDLIIPISARQGANNSVSQFTLPAQNATNTISFPRNVHRAVFSVSANGQANEEFWWSNVLQSDVYTFNSTAGALPGLSPFREVQVLIDGQLAGLQWPFPVIFTGGVVPSLHRPIVGIEAFDLREHEIDITPFLPLLCDGQQHTFTIRVAGLNDTGTTASAHLTETVNESWYVTGKIFVWLDDDPSSITTGDPPTIDEPPPVISISRSITTAANGTNETLTYSTTVSRSLQITARNLRTQPNVTTSSATWTQSLRYTNDGHLSAFGYNQRNTLSIQGADRAVLPRGARYAATYAYPLAANSSAAVSPQGNLTLWARLAQGKQLAVSGASVFPTGLEAFAGASGNGSASASGSGSGGAVVAVLRTSKEGTGSFYQSGDGKQSSGFGDARQVFWFGTADGDELYFRDVSAVNGSVVADSKRVGGKEEGASVAPGGEGLAAAVSYDMW
ncbi:05a0dc70-bc1d-444f-bbc2-980506bcb545 [Thermothielavioides terrestris]|uniref:05a0dc70-bc1d-444f-bbc2-980506bcb545 n=1 Tax=Thermothielavioides terrestris TaxID=2587410 RepID=A0A3S4ASZ6_9PEZI|nr:05a0dc70-bc1d-444f-bbc2-980506bcb545 [Thermothielavioides terrestris]